MTSRLYHECLSCSTPTCEGCKILDVYVKEEYEVFSNDKFNGARMDIIGQNGNIGYTTKDIEEPDVVNSPKHYKVFPDMEAIDVIQKVLTKEEYIGYLKGNHLKYRLRAGDKDDVIQDINKSNVYKGWLYETI